MVKHVQWITHKDREILLVDYSGIRSEEAYLAAIEEFADKVLSQPAGHRVLTLIDVTGSILTPTITERNKEVAEMANERGIPDSPTALVGISGFKLAVVQAMSYFRPDLYVASDRDAAKNWLVEQETE
jgi:hypothetical protein